jgi:alpha-methylacyl-CoA racemase
MLLADMGADVVRVERPGGVDTGIGVPTKFNLLNRNRTTIKVDLKTRAGVSTVLKLCSAADAIFEGNRPGVMEKLGLGPVDCNAVNRRLVYGRMTGWGQDGPLASAAGHDGNYAAIAGALGAVGDRDGPPVVPLNLVADFGGGGIYLALGLLAALLETERSGEGQIVDAAMVDGAASLMTLFYGLHAGGLWKDQRGSNFLDGAAPFYRPYGTLNNQYVMICAIEPRFFAVLLETLQTSEVDPAEQFDQSKWSEHIAVFDRVFATRTREEWTEIFSGTDACFAPVLSLAEAPAHPHNQARQNFVEIDGVVQPAPAPRFSRTPAEIRHGAGAADADIQDVLRHWGAISANVDNP